MTARFRDKGGTTSAGGGSGLRLRMRSESRRIASQHQQLNTLFGAVFQALDHGGIHVAADAFRRFGEALEAHFEVEERMYFPALHGMRPELEAEIIRLVDQHAAMRNEIVAILGLLGQRDRAGGCARLERLALEISKHESEEEALSGSSRPSGHPRRS